MRPKIEPTISIFFGAGGAKSYEEKITIIVEWIISKI